MSRKLFVANWKMHKTRAQARAWASELGEILTAKAVADELVAAPPFTALDAAADPAKRWALACQNVAAELEGAFTGEVSALMAADAGCRYAIVGHSERRREFHEDGPILARKLACCRAAKLTPIFCIGETAEERDADLTAATLIREVAALDADPRGAPLVVAYEPIWAIGTGRAATPEDAESARVHIAELLSDRSDLRILYGGSVTPESGRELLSGCRVDGFLIGGASLSARSFADIARA